LNIKKRTYFTCCGNKTRRTPEALPDKYANRASKTWNRWKY
jgi:hypothetical protein